jgi:hypothetical protein
MAQERYSDCNLSRRRGVTHRTGAYPDSLERTVFSCDYNGWADVPEEEREGVDAFEASRPVPPRAALPVPLIRGTILPVRIIPHRRAA